MEKMTLVATTVLAMTDLGPVSSDDFMICVWPDGTWCWLEEAHEYTHKSDDYQRMFFYEHPPALKEMTTCLPVQL